ncbi:MAG TPA: hypothetical protein VFA04_06695 [Bryobacteraceae bacterium]|nr:hypothetical protein [Bryobacteraceae bacterium]
MRVFFAPALLVIAVTVTAADTELPLGRSSNDKVEIQADLLLDKDQIRAAVGPNIPGADLGGSYVGVRVTVRPLSDAPVKIWREDFTMLSNKDGQRSTAFEPTQIAGSGKMVIKMVQGDTVGTGVDHRPVFSAGPIGVGVGGGESGTTAAPEMKDDTKNRDNPLLAALREKMLPDKAVTQPTTGLLFFEIDGKVKPKNLELFYKTEEGDKLGLRFANK